MSLLPSEAGGEEGRDELGGEGGADHPAPEAEDVDVVVLDGLVGGVRVVGQNRPDAFHLVRGNAGACARPADDDAPFGASVDDGAAHRGGEVGVVDRSLIVGAEIEDRIPAVGKGPGEGLLEAEAGVVGSESDAHGDCPFERGGPELSPGYRRRRGGR